MYFKGGKIMSVKFNKDKYNGYYATVNGRRFRGKSKEIILDKIKEAGKISDIVPISNLTVLDAINSFLPYSKETHEQNTYESYKYQLEQACIFNNYSSYLYRF